MQASVYFVMDLCEGGELYHLIRARGKGLPEPQAASMFKQVSPAPPDASSSSLLSLQVLEDP